VELVHGRARAGDTLSDIAHEPLTLESHELGQPAVFAGSVSFDRAGSFGYTVRVVPSNPALASSAELGLVAVPAG
jgi:starch phosphorylase